MNYLDQAKLTTLNNLVVSNLENILDDLGVKFRHSGNTLVCTCPIHGGDNRSAFNIYLDGEDIGGYWLCFTHGCHTQFKRNAIGLIQGILSHQNENWCESGDRRFPFNKTIEFLLKELNVTWEKLDSNPEAFEKAKFITSTRRLNKRVEQGKLQGISREKVRASLKIPSPYFIKRGFSPEILDEFDIGDCVKTGRPMSGRAVCPVYDNSGRVMVGCVGRSLYEKCEKCSLYHPIDFPCSTALSNQHLY